MHSCIHVSTTIRVSDETKARLAEIKRDDETWDEFLARLADEESTMEPGVWRGTGKADAAREAVKRSRESFER